MINTMLITKEQRKLIDSWVGTPYGHQQQCLGQKVDCYGITRAVLHILGIETTQGREYSRHPRPNILENWLTSNNFIEKKYEQTLEPGDILVINILGVPYHMHTYLGDGEYITCILDYGTFIGKLDDAQWKNDYTLWRIK